MSFSLSQFEADRLIELLKRCVDFAMYIPVQGESADYQVIDVDTSNEIFIALINRKNKFSDKCSFVLRYKKANKILLRLDVGCTSKHTNPDGTIIEGSHIHRYTEGFDEKFAMPIDFTSTTLENDLRHFLDIANIEEPQRIAAEIKLEN